MKNYDKVFGVFCYDTRNAILAELLEKEGYAVHRYMVTDKNCEEFFNNCNYIITTIPFDYGKFNFNFGIEEFFKKINSKVLITGKVSNDKDVIRMCCENNIKVIDLLDNEEMTILNAIPTSEGAIQIAMENTRKTLHSSNALVLGYGRIGKTLSSMLKNLGVKVTCEARKKSDVSWISVMGYTPLHIGELEKDIYNYDMIFNTIPYEIISRDMMERMRIVNKDCLIIDLASKPGGLDHVYAKELGLNAIWALALPSKVAPISSATYMKDVILQEIDN